MLNSGDGDDDERTGSQFAQGREGRFDLIVAARLDDMELHSLRTRRFLSVPDVDVGYRIVRVHQKGDRLSRGNQVAKQLDALGRQPE